MLIVFQSLPKTSYYKLIDWWLLVAMNLLVATMVFHTYVAYVVFRCKNRDDRGVGGFSLMRQARFMTPASRRQALANAKVALLMHFINV